MGLQLYQVVKGNGELSEVKYTEILMDVCEDEGTLTLQLPDKS